MSIQPTEAALRGHELGLEDGDHQEAVEEAGGEAEQEDAHCWTGEKEGEEEPVLVLGSRGLEVTRMTREEAEAGECAALP